MLCARTPGGTVASSKAAMMQLKKPLDNAIEAVAERLFDLQRLAIPAFGRSKIAPILRHHADLVIALGHAGSVAEHLLDLQRLAIPDFGRGKIAPLLRPRAEVVVARGHAGSVAERLFDLQRLAIPTFGRG